VQVSEDTHNYYVRLSATNNTSHTYRLQNAAVMKIDPAFGGDIAYQNVNHQIGADVFKEFRSTSRLRLSPTVLRSTSRTCRGHDNGLGRGSLQAGCHPAIFRWTFAADQGAEIDAVAISDIEPKPLSDSTPKARAAENTRARHWLYLLVRPVLP